MWPAHEKWALLCNDMHRGIFEELPVRHKPKQLHRLAVVSTMRDPLDIHTWLDHHRRLAVRHFFITVDRTPWLAAFLKAQPDVSIRDSTENIHGYHFWDIQSRNVTAFMGEAKAMGISHLLHIDDDELMYVHSYQKFVDCINSDPSIHCWRVQNFEAVAENDDVKAPLTDCRLFCKNKTQFAAYTNGKSIGCLTHNIKCNGAHNFTGKSEWIPQSIAVILHFDSIVFERWQAKFLKYRQEGGQEQCKTKAIPFKFYCESIDASPANILEVWRKYKRYQENKHDVVFINPKFNSHAVVLVGNAPMQKNYGALIDAFPWVVRFNGHKIDGFEDLIGRNTNTWCVSDHVVANHNLSFRDRGDLHILCVVANRPQNPNTVESIRKKLPDTADVVDAVEFRKTVEQPWLSTGCLAIEYFLHRTSSPLHICGFDSFTGKQLHYYADKEVSNHTSSFEQKFIANACKTGRVFKL